MLELKMTFLRYFCFIDSLSFSFEKITTFCQDEFHDKRTLCKGNNLDTIFTIFIKKLAFKDNNRVIRYVALSCSTESAKRSSDVWNIVVPRVLDGFEWNKLCLIANRPKHFVICLLFYKYQKHR